MKRFKTPPARRYNYIRSSSNSGSTAIMNLLHEKGIDTTSHNYELRAIGYGRYSDGPTYTKRFRCRGDYLAYFSMRIHEAPTFKNLLEDYAYGDIDELIETIEDHPSVADMKELASSSWYGDGDDEIIYLKNLDTGKLLYEGYYEEYEEYEGEDW